MCKEDIRIAKSGKTTATVVSAVGNSTVDGVGANRNRLRIIFSGDFAEAFSHSGTITGNVDPVTGNVNETISLDPLFCTSTHLGYMDGNTFVPIGTVSAGQPSIVIRIDDVGPAFMDALRVKNVSPRTFNVTIVEMSLEKPLEDV